MIKQTYEVKAANKYFTQFTDIFDYIKLALDRLAI
jgi:hypothetical protein